MRFKANGKLLLTGEYLVLLGATALVLPVRFGQEMTLSERKDRLLVWRSKTQEGYWFEGTFSLPELEPLRTNDRATADKLRTWMITLRVLRNDFLRDESGYTVTITANYPLYWGLGSSASLTSLLAQWSGVDPFHFHDLISRGSGADIACTQSDRLIRYHKMYGVSEFAEMDPGDALVRYTWFVYLGNSVETAPEITRFLKSKPPSERIMRRISFLSQEICTTSSAEYLEQLIREHESILAGILKKQPIGIRFGKFPGGVKSMGAWGGDFAMFVSAADPGTVESFFKTAGLFPVFRYPEIAMVP